MTQPRTPQQEQSGFKCISWNFNGLNISITCSKVLYHLQQLGAHIAFLLETHLSSSHIKVQGRWLSQVLHSTCNGKSRVLANLIRKSIPLFLL